MTQSTHRRTRVGPWAFPAGTLASLGSEFSHPARLARSFPKTGIKPQLRYSALTQHIAQYGRSERAPPGSVEALCGDDNTAGDRR
jgi:hypothetical protein